VVLVQGLRLLAHELGAQPDRVHVELHALLHLARRLERLANPGPPVWGRVLAQVARRLHLWGAGGSS